MTNSDEPPYDLRERALRFAALAVRFVRGLPSDVASRELGKQHFRSASSIGANVAEADASESRKDFIHKMSVARKEAGETIYWLRLASAIGTDEDTASDLLDEASQLVRILSVIVNKSRKALEE